MFKRFTNLKLTLATARNRYVKHIIAFLVITTIMRVVYFNFILDKNLAIINPIFLSVVTVLAVLVAIRMLLKQAGQDQYLITISPEQDISNQNSIKTTIDGINKHAIRIPILNLNPSDVIAKAHYVAWIIIVCPAVRFFTIVFSNYFFATLLDLIKNIFFTAAFAGSCGIIVSLVLIGITLVIYGPEIENTNPYPYIPGRFSLYYPYLKLIELMQKGITLMIGGSFGNFAGAKFREGAITFYKWGRANGPKLAASAFTAASLGFYSHLSYCEAFGKTDIGGRLVLWLDDGVYCESVSDVKHINTIAGSTDMTTHTPPGSRKLDPTTLEEAAGRVHAWRASGYQLPRPDTSGPYPSKLKKH